LNVYYDYGIENVESSLISNEVVEKDEVQDKMKIEQRPPPLSPEYHLITNSMIDNSQFSQDDDQAEDIVDGDGGYNLPPPPSYDKIEKYTSNQPEE